MSAASSSQAWAILSRHARDEINQLRLQDLCRDDDRVSGLVTVHNQSDKPKSYTRASSPPRTSRNGNKNNNQEDSSNDNRILLVDLSRQRMTLDTLNHLLRFSTTRKESTGRNLTDLIRMLAWGQNDPNDPIVPIRIRVQQQHQQSSPEAYKKKTRFVEEAVAMASSFPPYLGEQQQQQQQIPSRSNYNMPASPVSYHRRDSPLSDGAQSPTSSTAGTPSAAGVSTTSGIGKLQHVTSPSMHLALRAPQYCGLEMLTTDGQNALVEIHQEWDRMKRFSDSLRMGKLRGANGSSIRDVIVVGRGVPIAALQFLHAALLKDTTAKHATSRTDSYSSTASSSHSTSSYSMGSAYSMGSGSHHHGSVSSQVSAAASSALRRTTSTNQQPQERRLRFLSSVDPSSIKSALSNLDAGSTLIISIDLKGTDETALATRAMKNWLIQSLGSSKRPDLIVSKHMMLVTGSEQLRKSYNKPENVFLIPEHSRCEAFTTFTAATLLPLSIIFGWSIVDKLIAGAHDIDIHFVETNPRHNLPVLLALTDFWNEALLGSFGRIITPFTGAFGSYPTFVAALEAQACGRVADKGLKPSTSTSADRTSCSGMVIDGGLCGTYDRALYQGGQIIPSELVMTMDTQPSCDSQQTVGTNGLEELVMNQDTLMCSFFAHADALAFGTEGAPVGSTPLNSSPRNMEKFWGPTGRMSLEAADVAEGNRPSALVLCGKLDAFACGQLIALAEHRAVVKAHLWDIDPFVRVVGSSLREKRTESLKGELHEMYDRIAITGNADMEEDEHEKTATNVNYSTSTILAHYATIAKSR